MKPVQTKTVVIIAAAVVAAIIAGIATASMNNAVMSDKASSNRASAAQTAPTERTFWIDTIHLDGNANINGDSKHPPEPYPANAIYPKGGGFVLTPPDKSGTWNFRSFTFSISQIVVYQGDKVTLNFVGVQGPTHYIDVDGIASFPLTRGQIHPVTFTADKVGTIRYTCHIHMPNMEGEVLVLPRPA